MIRKYRLDEIPQLWNVLIQHEPDRPAPRTGTHGQGIRPFILLSYRHLVRPGLSGWAQVQQGYVGTHEETVTKLSYDLYYEALFVCADLLIAVKTLRTLFDGIRGPARTTIHRSPRAPRPPCASCC
ncbi:sugar transferase [Cupriavidus basilensis]